MYDGAPIFGNAPIAARTGGERGEGGTWNVDGPRVLFHPIRYIEPPIEDPDLVTMNISLSTGGGWGRRLLVDWMLGGGFESVNQLPFSFQFRRSVLTTT